MTELTLSPRQRDVLKHIADGYRPKQHDRLGIAYGTFREHLMVAYRKLGANNDAHAVAIALRRGLIE